MPPFYYGGKPFTITKLFVQEAVLKVSLSDEHIVVLFACRLVEPFIKRGESEDDIKRCLVEKLESGEMNGIKSL